MAATNSRTKNRVATAAADPAVMEVSAPNFQELQVKVIGTAPYVQHKMGPKTITKMIADQERGSAKGKTTSKKEPKDFNGYFENAQYRDKAEGWHGIPAAGFRAAMVGACRATGTVMTRAKMCVFVLADGYDKDENKALVKIIKGKPHRVDVPCRNSNGSADIRALPMWDVGWEAVVRIQFDADMIDAPSVMNLLMRAGMQMGIGEGRPSAPKNTGMGQGTFSIESAK